MYKFWLDEIRSQVDEIDKRTASKIMMDKFEVDEIKYRLDEIDRKTDLIEICSFIAMLASVTIVVMLLIIFFSK